MQVIFELIRTLVAPAAQVFLALLGAYLITLWITIIIWTFRDIETRSRSVVTQAFATLLTVFFFLPGLVLYLILRPKETLDEAFQRALQEEYLLQDLEELPLCPSCRRYSQSDYVLCPNCHTRLRENCPGCGRLVELRWDICPYCTSGLPGADESQVEVEPEVIAPPRIPVWVGPAVERLRARLLSGHAPEPVSAADEPAEARSIAEPAPPAAPVADEATGPVAARNGHHGPDVASLPARERESRSSRRAHALRPVDAPSEEPAVDAPADEPVPTEATGTRRE